MEDSVGERYEFIARMLPDDAREALAKHDAAVSAAAARLSEAQGKRQAFLSARAERVTVTAADAGAAYARALAGRDA